MDAIKNPLDSSRINGEEDGNRYSILNVYEIKKSGSIGGYLHCKDCNKKSNLTRDQNGHKQLKKITEDFEKSIKRVFR